MDWLIIFGTLLTVVGLVGLVVSAVKVIRARRAGLENAAFHEVVRRAMALNMGAFGLSALGLTMVVVGALLA